MSEPVSHPTMVAPNHIARVLEELADLARQGKIRSAAFVAVDNDGAVDSWYSFTPEASVFTMLGAIELLKLRTFEAVDVGD